MDVEVIERAFEFAVVRHKLKVQRWVMGRDAATFGVQLRGQDAPMIAIWVPVATVAEGCEVEPLRFSIQLNEYREQQFMDGAEVVRAACQCLEDFLEAELAGESFSQGYVNTHGHVRLFIDEARQTYPESVMVCAAINYPLSIDRLVDLMVGAAHELEEQAIIHAPERGGK